MKEVTIVTHNGGFHADDVFAVVTVILFLPKDTKYSVVRTRDMEAISRADYVVDVGRVYDPSERRFDHHQEAGGGVRENGIPYASFGLVWKEFGTQVAGNEKLARIIEEKLVLPIDAADNGVTVYSPVFEGIRPYTLSDYLYSYWLDEHANEEGLNEIFNKVVNLAGDLLLREIKKASHIILDESRVEEAYQKTLDKRIIVLDAHLAWDKILAQKEEPLVVVYPSVDGARWNAKTVAAGFQTFTRRVLFPEVWAGKVDKELQELSEVGDAVFCHRGRFIATADSKEGAVALAKKLIS